MTEINKDKYGAPERIFLQLHGDDDPDLEDGPFVDCTNDVSWCWESIFEHDVEYVRLDLFAASEKKVRELTQVDTTNFISGVQKEATFQIKKWGKLHDKKKDEADWYWSAGFLIGKALFSSLKGDFEKAKHHTISGAALLFQWHESLTLSEENDSKNRS